MSLVGRLLGLASLATAFVSPDGTGRLPAMGWNSWNEYECNISEDVFITVARQLVNLWLRDLGYEYVNIDDCWSDKEQRRNATTDELIPDSKKFPRGIIHVADEVHSLGLKLGIYSDAGSETCGGYAGSLGYEELDSATFSRWGIDYLKYDNCNVPSEWADEYEYIPEEPTSNAPAGYDWGSSNTAKRYRAMSGALQRQNRTIQYSLCAWGHAHVEQWGNSTGHSWRMWGDIFPAWKGKEKWSWEVGNGELTIEENRSHFALWCAFKSPLIIGTPLDTLALRKPILDILSNRELIDFNQDSVYGASAMPYKWGNDRPANTSDREHPAAFWVGTSVKGIHVFLLNTQDTAVNMRAVFAEIPPLKAVADQQLLVHDMWSGQDLGTFTECFELEVNTHDTAALRITTVEGKHPNASWSPR
ncbi:family 27 putative glycoside hydrolase [Cercophora samala]|uniref:Alpha-galactosidase n=1 Tax=Cercophora samala TaxID=330535 RepID=A0AA39ZID4_9PEZI|nr:family 27 putative glycoside hydrolase [Cercophora samala]